MIQVKTSAPFRKKFYVHAFTEQESANLVSNYVTLDITVCGNELVTPIQKDG